MGDIESRAIHEEAGVQGVRDPLPEKSIWKDPLPILGRFASLDKQINKLKYIRAIFGQFRHFR